MKNRHIQALDSFLADPGDPRWSSTRLDQMLQSIDGSAVEQVLAVLELVDDQFLQTGCELNAAQTNFIRAITLHAYTAGVVPIFHSGEADWLLQRFADDAAPHRALMIALLIPLDSLSKETRSSMLKSLESTPGIHFIDPEFRDGKTDDYNS